MLIPSAENFTDVPNCERFEEKERNKAQRLHSKVAENKVELWTARS
jgi:hypothetical protein